MVGRDFRLHENTEAVCRVSTPEGRPRFVRAPGYSFVTESPGRRSPPARRDVYNDLGPLLPLAPC